MTYSLKLINNSGVVTYNPAVDSPMNYVGTYTMPAYTATANTTTTQSVAISGMADDNSWFVVNNSAPDRYTTYYISPGNFVSSTTAPSVAQSIAAFSFEVYRNNLTAIPNTGYGFWTKNDANYVAAQTNNPSWVVVTDPTVVSSGFSLTTLSSGYYYAAKPTNNNTFIYIDTSTSPYSLKTYDGSSIEYIVVTSISNITKDTSGYGFQIFNSSGNLTFSGKYRQVISTKILNAASDGTNTTWTAPASKNAYVLVNLVGFRTSSIIRINQFVGYFCQAVPTWTSQNSGGSTRIATAFNGPPVIFTGPPAFHTFFQISG
jgi:hypothetical protein